MPLLNVSPHDATVELWIACASRDLATAWRDAIPKATADELAALREVERDRRIVQLALRRSVLAALLDRPLREIPLVTPTMGAITPPSPTVSISASHHDDMTVVAVAEGSHGLGVDIEPLYEPGWDDALSDVLVDRELADIEALSTAERPGAYFACWTLKEAIMKALGEGLSDRDPKSIEVTVPPAVAQLRSLDGLDAPKGWNLATLRLDRHVCSVAVVGAGGLFVRCRRWPVDLPPQTG